MSDYPNCTEACAAMPRCTKCHRTKPPRGRSVGMAAVSGYCGYDCEGYDEEPRAGHMWPEEWREELSQRAGEQP